MSYIFNFPDIGEGLDEGTLLEIYVEVGQTIKSGDLLVNMETDKVTTDIPSPRSGKVLKIFGEVGDIIKVNSPLVELELEGSEATATAPSDVADTSDDEPAGVVGTLEIADASSVLPSSNETISTPARTDGSKSLAVPKVRGVAKGMSIDINRVTGTGPEGRVILEDLQRFIKPQDDSVPKTTLLETVSTKDYSDDEVTYHPLTQIRKAIARTMIAAKHNAAHVTLFEEVEVSDLIEIRAKLKEAYLSKGVKLTYLPFIVKATVLALKKHPILNSRIEMDNSRVVTFNDFNIGIAIDTPEGLVVPVIRNADQLSIYEIAQQITDFSIRGMERQLTMKDMKHGTFTISNFGSISGLFGTPILNYPQVGVLGVGRIARQPVVKGDEVVPGSILGLSLTVDHRVIDGGDSARFTKAVMDYLANPISLLME